MKRIQLDIMDAIHHFCVEHNIKYSLGYGTLLGAVRHGGYIPWDDDIDIIMLRRDYERFLREFDDPGGRFAISECRRDPKQLFDFAKVHDTRTIWYQAGNNVDTGIWVDIFPYDDLEDTYEESLAIHQRYSYLYNYKTAKNCNWGMMSSFIKNVGLMFYKLRYLLSPPPPRKMLGYINTMLERNKPHSKYVGYLSDKFVYIIERSYFDDIVPIRFEDRTYLCIKEKEKYLAATYGDYMQLPPEDQRLPHSQLGLYWRDKW